MKAEIPFADDLKASLIFRLANQDDLNALEWDGELSHFRRIFHEAYQQYLRGTGLIWLTELPENRLVAQAFIQLRPQQPVFANGNSIAYLYGFRVKPAYRNKGIGTQLMQVIETDIVQRSYHKLTLNVGRENWGAYRLYRRLGYRVVGADPGRWSYVDHHGIKQTVNEPAWRMEKNLDGVNPG